MARYKRKRKVEVNYKAINEALKQMEGRRVVGYCRVSTKDQVDGVSLEDQEREIQRWCIYKGYDLVGMYIEKGESGATEDRTEFKKMLKDAEEGKFDWVVVFSIDRFSRDFRIAMESMFALDDTNVTIKVLDKDFDTKSAMGKFLFSIFSQFAEDDRKAIKRRLLMGKKDKVKQGKYLAKKPYGYDVIDGELVPNEKEAQVVKEIFHLRAKKTPFRGIAEYLNVKGIQSPTGRKWNQMTIKKIIENKIYTGEFTQKVDDIEVTVKFNSSIISKQMYGICNKRIYGERRRRGQK